MRSAPVPSLTPMSVPQSTAGSFGQIVKEGIGFGAGAEIGRTVVQSALGLFRSSSQTTAPPEIPAPVKSSEIPSYASVNYTTCLEHTQNDVAACRPFLSKESSPWTQCMETNFYQKEYCNSSQMTR